MIALLASAVFGAVEVARLANGIPVVYEREVGSRTIALSAVVRLDDLSPLELDAVDALVDSWHGGTESLTLHRLNALAAQSGGRIGVTLAADCVRYDASVPRESLPLAITLMSELFLRPEITSETIQAGKEQRRRALFIAGHPLERGIRSLLKQAGLFGAGTRVPRTDEVEAVWRRAFRSERIAIGVVGNIPLEEVVHRIGASLGSWQPDAPAPAARRSAGDALPVKESSQPVVGILLSGPPPQDERFSAFLVGLTALLDGKGSLVGREVRYARSLAYEFGVLRFVRGGRTWALLYLNTTEKRVGEEVLSLIQVGASQLTEEDLERGKAYLLAGLRYRGGSSLLSSLSGGTVEPIDRAHRYAWLQAFAVRGGPGRGFERALSSVTASEVREMMVTSVRDARVLAGDDTLPSFARQNE